MSTIHALTASLLKAKDVLEDFLISVVSDWFCIVKRVILLQISNQPFQGAPTATEAQSYWKISRPRFETEVGKVCMRAKRPIWPALILSFYSMRQQGVFLLPPGCDVSPCLVHQYPLYTWVERGTESKVSCPRAEHNALGQSLNPDRSILRRAR